MAIRIQIRSGSSSEWTTANPLLMEGEMGAELDTGKFKIGNGIDRWNALPYTATKGDTPTLTPMGVYTESLITLGATSGAINLNNGNVFQITPSTTITFAISNAKAGAHSFTLIVHQGATARALTWPASIKWVGGEVPDVSETNKSYLFTFTTVNSGSKWFGIFAGDID